MAPTHHAPRPPARPDSLPRARAHRSSKASADAKAATERQLKQANEDLQWQEFRQLHLRVEQLQRAADEQRRRRWWWSIPGLDPRTPLGRPAPPPVPIPLPTC